MRVIFKNIIISILTFLPIVLFINGCAYFNMFYNAKEHYEKAEKTRITQNKIDRKGYDDSLKELSKILEFYPDHELVDDALLMMGKCFFRKKNYSKAERKYKELLSNFKDSELVPKAKLGLAEVEIAKKNFEEADMMIKEIGKDVIGEDSYEVKRLFADLSLALGDSSLAVNRYNEASLIASNEEEILENLKIAAEISENIKDYLKAAEFYNTIFKKSSIRKDLFSFRLKYGEMVQKQNFIDSAIVIYNGLIDNEEYASYSLEAEVILSRLYFGQKEYKKTYNQLEEILRINEKTKENEKILAEVSYYLGEYFLSVDRDLVTSKIFYDSVTFFYKDRKDELIKKTKKKKKIINKYDSLKTFFYNFPFEKDTLTEYVLELNKEISELNNIEDTLKFKNKSKELKDIEKKLKRIDKKYIFANFTLAELFRYDLEYIDSSVVYFNKVKNIKKYPHMASRAYLIEAYVHKDIYKDNAKFEIYLDSIFYKYPNTKVSNHIRDLKGLKKVTVIEDTASYLYDLASQNFIDSNYVEAYIGYMDIVDRFNESTITPKVLKSAAILQEDYLKNKDLAKVLYEKLNKDYKKTIESKFAMQKLKKPDESSSTSVVKNDEKEKKNDKDKEKKKNLSTQDKWYLMDRRND